jgi:hypothetical protein
MAVADKTTQALPQCSSRIARAVVLVRAGAVELLPDGTARVTSQRDGQTIYHTVSDQCDCQDFPQAPEGYCKHRLASRIARHAIALLQQHAQDAASTPASQDNLSQYTTPPRRGKPTVQELIDAAVEQAERACRAAIEQTDPAYRGFLTLLSQKKKVAETQGKPVYAEVRLPYMAVDGRVHMAIDEHRAQRHCLEIQTEFFGEATSGHLLCRATVRSPLRGTVTAHARVFLGGSGVNTTNPLENGETSAIGRALGFLGYGLYGTGIASTEEVLQAQATRETNAPEDGALATSSQDVSSTPTGKPPTARQRELIRKLLAEQGATQDAIDTRLATVTTSRQASSLIDQLRTQAAV